MKMSTRIKLYNSALSAAREFIVYCAAAVGVVVGLFVLTPKGEFSFEPFLMSFFVVAALGIVAELTLTHDERKIPWLHVFRQLAAFLIGVIVCNAFYY